MTVAGVSVSFARRRLPASVRRKRFLLAVANHSVLIAAAVAFLAPFVFITLTARALNPALFIVARSSFPDSMEKLRRAGANQVVSPYLMGAHRMAALAVRPVAVDVLDTVLHGENIDLVVEEFMVPAASRMLGRTLGDSGLRSAGANVLAVRKRSGQLRINPPDSLVLESDDLLVAIGTREQVDAAERLL